MTSPASPKKRILFVCAGNTCRSPMAEFLARRNFSNILETSSVGFQPGNRADVENAIYTLRKLFDIDASGHTPRRITEKDVAGADFIVTMDGWVARQFKQEFPAYATENLVEWKIPDFDGDDLQEYERCVSRIYKAIKGLVAEKGLA